MSNPPYPRYALGNNEHRQRARTILQTGRSMPFKCLPCINKGVACVVASGFTKCALCTSTGSSPARNCQPSDAPRRQSNNIDNEGPASDPNTPRSESSTPLLVSSARRGGTTTQNATMSSPSGPTRTTSRKKRTLAPSATVDRVNQVSRTIKRPRTEDKVMPPSNTRDSPTPPTHQSPSAYAPSAYSSPASPGSFHPQNRSHRPSMDDDTQRSAGLQPITSRLNEIEADIRHMDFSLNAKIATVSGAMRSIGSQVNRLAEGGIPVTSEHSLNSRPPADDISPLYTITSRLDSLEAGMRSLGDSLKAKVERLEADVRRLKGDDSNQQLPDGLDSSSTSPNDVPVLFKEIFKDPGANAWVITCRRYGGTEMTEQQSQAQQ